MIWKKYDKEKQDDLIEGKLYLVIDSYKDVEAAFFSLKYGFSDYDNIRNNVTHYAEINMPETETKETSDNDFVKMISDIKWRAIKMRDRQESVDLDSLTTDLQILQFEYENYLLNKGFARSAPETNE